LADGTVITNSEVHTKVNSLSLRRKNRFKPSTTPKKKKAAPRVKVDEAALTKTRMWSTWRNNAMAISRETLLLISACASDG